MSLDDYFVNLDEDLRRRFGIRDDPRKIYRRERKRHNTNKARILRLLLDGGLYHNIDLDKITPRYGARILELRREGWDIETIRIGGGLWGYKLKWHIGSDHFLRKIEPFVKLVVFNELEHKITFHLRDGRTHVERFKSMDDFLDAKVRIQRIFERKVEVVWP